jgi:ATP/maltotriose-dependent transcriptional regulator MalT
MVCHFTDTTCKYKECGLWDEKLQACHFILLVDKLLGNGDKPMEGLTLQERNILSLIAQGYSNE